MSQYPNILLSLQKALNSSYLAESKEIIHKLLHQLHCVTDSVLIWQEEAQNFTFPKNYLIDECRQILESQTVERSQYYIKRLMKSITEEKQSPINDLNLNRWKEYDDIWTDSLWLIDKRDASGAHSASYWGNFVPQIPRQLMRRYTKQGDWVLDTFLGSGTTLMECKRWGRNGIGIELQPNIAQWAKENIQQEKSLYALPTQQKIITNDCLQVNYLKELEKLGIDEVQLVILHPPYWDIIQFSELQNDFSNAQTLESFLSKLHQLIELIYPILEKNRFLALIISDKYEKAEWIPLGFYAMQEVLKSKFRLKATIIKNFEETKGKVQQKELWRYRALAGGFYVFKHEYIFLFQKIV